MDREQGIAVFSVRDFFRIIVAADRTEITFSRGTSFRFLMEQIDGVLKMDFTMMFYMEHYLKITIYCNVLMFSTLYKYKAIMEQGRGVRRKIFETHQSRAGESIISAKSHAEGLFARAFY